jgi:hypothetical protein
MPTPLMLAQRLAPDDLRSQFRPQPYRPDVLPTGEPMPGAGEDATAVWGQIGHNLTDWQPGEAGNTAREYMNSLLLGTTSPGAPAAPGFRAFHGSPHSFERFSTDAIGTGEGAQAYGHGLYFAENEGVARGYRDALTPGADIAKLLDTHGGNADAALTELLNSPNGPRAADYDALLQYRKTGVPPSKGSMYEVNINADPEHFLHWDKPRDQLAPKVQDFAKSNYPEAWDAAADGSSLYQLMAKQAQSPVALTQQMADAGIPGIRYLDQGSRAEGEGTHNAVVFNPATIEILRKYGLAGLGLGTAATAAGTQDEGAP